MTKSIKTSEFWLVTAVVITWGLRYLGFDLSPETVQHDVVLLADQLKELAKNGGDGAGIYLAGLYAILRTALKWRQAG